MVDVLRLPLHQIALAPSDKTQEGPAQVLPDVLCWMKAGGGYGPTQGTIPTSTKDTVYTLNTGPQYIANKDSDEAIRELLGNLLDEVARANRPNGTPTLAGVRVEVIARGSVCVFYNESERLAAICYECDAITKMGTLRFINYGAYIKDGREILRYGYTDKRGTVNLKGVHGEGLKLAIAIAVGRGCSVEIMAICGTPKAKYTAQRWHFFLDEDVESKYRRDIRYEVSRNTFKREGIHVVDTHCDWARFQVTIGFEVNGPHTPWQFFLERYALMPFEKHEIPQILMSDPDRANIYVYGFWVQKFDPQHLLFGYNFTSALQLSRDRDGIPMDALYRAIGETWSAPGAPLATLFEVLLRGESEISSYAEYHAVSHLSAEACTQICALFEAKFSGVYPCSNVYFEGMYARGRTRVCSGALLRVLQHPGATGRYPSEQEFFARCISSAFLGSYEGEDPQLLEFARVHLEVDIKSITRVAEIRYLFDATKRVLYVNTELPPFRGVSYDGEEHRRTTIWTTILIQWMENVANFHRSIQHALVAQIPRPLQFAEIYQQIHHQQSSAPLMPSLPAPDGMHWEQCAVFNKKQKRNE